MVFDLVVLVGRCSVWAWVLMWLKERMLPLGLSPTCSGLLLSTRPSWWMMRSRSRVASTQVVRLAKLQLLQLQ